MDGNLSTTNFSNKVNYQFMRYYKGKFCHSRDFKTLCFSTQNNEMLTKTTQQPEAWYGNYMDPIWKTAIKVTGSVGVVSFLFGTLLKLLFQEQIVALFGSDRMFYIVILILGIFAIAIILAILKSSRSTERSSKVVYKDNATHKGNNKF